MTANVLCIQQAVTCILQCYAVMVISDIIFRIDICIHVECDYVVYMHMCDNNITTVVKIAVFTLCDSWQVLSIIMTTDYNSH